MLGQVQYCYEEGGFEEYMGKENSLCILTFSCVGFSLEPTYKKCSREIRAGVGGFSMLAVIL